jgi:hypothetical protein
VSPTETGLVALSTGLLAAIITGAGVYVKLGRQVLTRDEHEKECDKTLGPIRKDIDTISKTTRRIEDKGDDSTKDLSDKLQEILIQLGALSKLNGG